MVIKDLTPTQIYEVASSHRNGCQCKICKEHLHILDEIARGGRNGNTDRTELHLQSK